MLNAVDAKIPKAIAGVPYGDTTHIARGKKFFVRDLSDAFDTVANPTDWRAPISAIIEPAHVDLVAAAIEFYTATTASFRLVDSSKGWKVIAESVGYRAGPAGP